jgi:hypothetical protein
MRPRVLALGSLAAVVLALVSIVAATGAAGDGYRQELGDRMRSDLRASAELSDALAALTAGESPAAAKRALDRSVALQEGLVRWLAITLPGEEWTLSSRADVALRRHGAWLDAVGSVLNNPRSPLLDEVRGRAERAREALDLVGLTGVDGSVVRGEDVLAVHARARLR